MHLQMCCTSFVESIANIQSDETKGRAKEKSAAFRPLSLSNPTFHEKPDDEHVYRNQWHRVPLDDVERPRYSMEARSSQTARPWPRLPITPRKSHFN